MRKFIFSPDKHWGYQQTGKGLEPLHCEKSIQAMLKFAGDFKPHVWIEGGDNIDYGPVSHWLKDKKKSSKDLDLRRDTEEYAREVLEPIDEIMSWRCKDGAKQKIWMKGNHEGWADEFGEENPGAASLVQPEALMDLSNWDVVEEGGYRNLGRLLVVHGDKIGNGGNVAQKAVNLYGNSVIFGHFHTYQVSPKHELVGVDNVKAGFAIPGMCHKNPGYMGNRPNQWMKGFAYGYVHEDGSFQVYPVVIIGGKFAAEGRVYRG